MTGLTFTLTLSLSKGEIVSEADAILDAFDGCTEPLADKYIRKNSAIKSMNRPAIQSVYVLEINFPYNRSPSAEFYKEQLMTDMNLSELMITSVLIAIHWIPLLVAALLWPLKKINFSLSSAITVLFTIVAWLIVAICLFLFFDVKANGRPMTGFGAYLIYSIMTLGVLPIAIIAVHIFAGRSAGFWIRSRSRGHQGGVAS